MYRISSNINGKITKLKEFEHPVQSGKTTSPAQAMKLVEQGVPISTHNANADLFFDGDDNPSFDIPLDRQRNADINDMWNEMHDVNKRVGDFINSKRKKKGEE